MVGGGERIIELGNVNGHVFVNNVSLGPNATALHRPGCRGAKLRTLLGAAPDGLDGVDRGRYFRWSVPTAANTVAPRRSSSRQPRPPPPGARLWDRATP